MVSLFPIPLGGEGQGEGVCDSGFCLFPVATSNHAPSSGLSATFSPEGEKDRGIRFILLILLIVTAASVRRSAEGSNA